MSFFNKIIDKAKHGAHLHHHHHQPSDPTLTAAANSNDNTTAANTSRAGEDTNLGIHTPHSSTSEAEQHNQQQNKPTATTTNATTTPSNNNTAAAGYVTPRASVDKPSAQNNNATQMDVDSTNAGKHPYHIFLSRREIMCVCVWIRKGKTRVFMC